MTDCSIDWSGPRGLKSIYVVVFGSWRVKVKVKYFPKVTVGEFRVDVKVNLK